MKLLSYPISESTPIYGNNTGILLSADKQIINGDSCNTMFLSFPNHIGTHIDLPYHFDSNGKTLNDYDADFWIFENVVLINVSDKVNDCQIIKPHLIPEIDNKDIDLLLIKSGYGKLRKTKRYTMTPPGLAADMAKWLRIHYPKVKCVGIDFISVSSICNKKEGRKAHHAFLNAKSGTPILLIEDMNLDYEGPFDKVIIAPLLIESADGVPCTIFAL